jgi:tetratricopeptide (TPR) repeat protein
MSTATLLQKAVARETRGDLVGAATEYRKVLKREPDNIDALFLLGRAHCQQGRFEPAADLLHKVISLNGNYAPAYNLLGVTLCRLGRPGDGLATFERALAINPHFELALINKGDALDALGRSVEALAEYDKALGVNPRNVVTWCNRGTALESLGRDAKAAESFERALALNPNLAEVHFNLANALQRLERHEEAVTHYRRAVALRPEFALAFVNLGRALSALARWPDAIDSYARALGLGAASPQLHYAMAVAFEQLERYEESLASADKVLAIDPQHVAALNRKGSLLLTLGRMEEARQALERALAFEPRNFDGYAVLSSVKKFASGDAHLTAMERLAADVESCSADDRIKLHFALGKAYRDTGDHALSFHHLLRGNALKRGQVSYDEQAAIENLDRITTVFTSALMRAKSGHGDSCRQPIFIVGMMRSGTTLIEQILASHPQVHGAGERSDFKLAVEKVTGPVAYPDLVSSLTPTQLDAIGANYVAGLAEQAKGVWFTDKMPANFSYAGLIHLTLPNARIIHARRDPVDTCLSCFSTLFQHPLNYTYDLAELGRFYRAYERVMTHWRRVLPQDAMLEVQYEDVVKDIETQARRILDYCGLPWDEACLAFHKATRPVRTASVGQVRQPLYRSSVGRWQAYREQLKPLLMALGEPTA